MIKFENSFSNFLTSNNYFQRFLPNKDKFEKLINKMHELIEECFELSNGRKYVKK